MTDQGDDLLPSEGVAGDEARKNVIRSYHAHGSNQKELYKITR
jgi:hypothetical protein